jgi:Big-like domain-containing protein
VIRRAAPAAGLLAAGLAGALLGGCAKPDFPPGGPIDTIPPRVLLTAPADSTTRVPPSLEIEILFSEPMDRVSVRDGFRIYPPPGAPSYHWNGRRFRVSWEEPLRPNTTYQAFLSAGARDQHGVILGSPVTIRFSTGDSLDPGRIRGVVRAKTLPTRGVPIWAFPESLGLRPDFLNAVPSYATETDTGTAYALSGLPLGRGFTIHAVYDIKADGVFDSLTDVAVSYPSVIRLTPEQPVADSINLIAVDPRAPAVVSGKVASPDSTARFRVEARSDSDTTFVRFVDRKGPGDYLLRLPPGRYRLRALRLPVTGGAPQAETRREELLIARPEEQIEHVDFRFERAVKPAPAPAPPTPEE